MSSTPEAWHEFRLDVERKCLALASGNLNAEENLEAIVDEYGSGAIGAALVKRTVPTETPYLVCIYDKKDQTAEISRPLNTKDALSALDGKSPELHAILLKATADRGNPFGEKWSTTSVTQPYACFDCIREINVKYKFHQGMDLFAAGASVAVYPVAEGKVCAVLDNEIDTIGFGNGLIVEHSEKSNQNTTMYTLYAHLASKPTLSLGTTVWPTTQIGKMGGTGFGSTDTWKEHLHLAAFELPDNSNNPAIEVDENGACTIIHDNKTPNQIRNGYSEFNPEALGIVDPWRVIAPLAKPTVVEITDDTRSGQLPIRYSPNSAGSIQYTASFGQRFVAYAALQDKSWYLIQLPCGLADEQVGKACSGWIGGIQDSCTNGRCMAEQPRIPYYTVTESTAELRAQSGLESEVLSKLWMEQFFTGYTDASGVDCEQASTFFIDLPTGLAGKKTKGYLLRNPAERCAGSKAEGESSGQFDTENLPPREIAQPGVCPFEGCQLGKWVAREVVPVYDGPNGLVKLNIRPGETITALDAEVRAQPIRAVVTHVYRTDETQGIHVGDVVFALYPLGEGAIAVWHRGRVKEGSLDLALRFDETHEDGQLLRYTWWVLVKLKNGVTGWLKDPRRFDGMDAHG